MAQAWSRKIWRRLWSVIDEVTRPPQVPRRPEGIPIYAGGRIVGTKTPDGRLIFDPGIDVDATQRRGAGLTMLAPGTLVIFERDPHNVAAIDTYVVLGEASPENGKARLRIQAITRRYVRKPGVTRFEPMTVLASECASIAAFGMRVQKIVRKSSGHYCSSLPRAGP